MIGNQKCNFKWKKRHKCVKKRPAARYAHIYKQMVFSLLERRDRAGQGRRGCRFNRPVSNAGVESWAKLESCALCVCLGQGMAKRKRSCKLKEECKQAPLRFGVITRESHRQG